MKKWFIFMLSITGTLYLLYLIISVIIYDGWSSLLDTKITRQIGNSFGIFSVVASVIMAYALYHQVKTTSDRAIKKSFMNFKVKFLLVDNNTVRGFDFKNKNTKTIKKIFILADQFCFENKKNKLNRHESMMLERLLKKFYEELALIVGKHETTPVDARKQLIDFEKYIGKNIKTISLFDRYIDWKPYSHKSKLDNIQTLYGTWNRIEKTAVWKQILKDLIDQKCSSDMDSKMFIKNLRKDGLFENDFPNLLEAWEKLYNVRSKNAV